MHALELILNYEKSFLQNNMRRNDFQTLLCIMAGLRTSRQIATYYDINQSVSSMTINRLHKNGFLTFDEEEGEYNITESGEEAVLSIFSFLKLKKKHEKKQTV